MTEGRCSYGPRTARPGARQRAAAIIGRLTMKTTLTASLVLLALALSAGPAAGHDLLRLSGGVANQWAWTDSVDGLQRSDRFLVGELRFGVGVWEGLSVEAGYRHISGSGTTFGAVFDTDTVLDAIDLAVRYDWPLLSWLSVYGRAGGTAAYVSTEVRWSTARIESASWTPGVFAAAGVDVRFPRHWFGGEDGPDGGRGFTVGLAFDIGYAWFLPVDVAGRADPSGALDADSDDNGRIAQAELDLGSLSVHGLTYTASLVLHY